jgi:hypothetical protein
MRIKATDAYLRTLYMYTLLGTIEKDWRCRPTDAVLPLPAWNIVVTPWTEN